MVMQGLKFGVRLAAFTGIGGSVGFTTGSALKAIMQKAAYSFSECFFCLLNKNAIQLRKLFVSKLIICYSNNFLLNCAF